MTRGGINPKTRKPEDPKTLGPMPTLARNRDAPYRYDLLEKLEAGIVLKGPEVKSVRLSRVSLTGSYVTLHGNEARLVNCHVAPYPKAAENPDPRRSRRLLLKKTDFLKLQGRLREGPLTVIPVSLYTKGGFIKVELALARGKRRADRRETIKRREVTRRIERALRGRVKHP